MKKTILLSLGLTSLMLTTTQAIKSGESHVDPEALKAQVQTQVVLDIANNGLADILKSPLCKEPKIAELIEMCTRTELTLVAMDATIEAHKPAIQAKAAPTHEQIPTTAEVSVSPMPGAPIAPGITTIEPGNMTIEPGNMTIEPGNIAEAAPTTPPAASGPTPAVTATVEPAAAPVVEPSATTAPATAPSTTLVPVGDTLPKPTAETAMAPAAASNPPTPATQITITTAGTPTT